MSQTRNYVERMQSIYIVIHDLFKYLKEF